MRVILMTDVKNLGKMNEIKEVETGYAVNFLIPKGFCVEANRMNISKLSNRLRTIEVNKNNESKKEETFINMIKNIGTLKIVAKCGRDNKLFGSITNKDISDALGKHRINIDKKDIICPFIKSLGSYKVEILFKQHSKLVIDVEIISE